MAIQFTIRQILAERGISERQFCKDAGIREGTFYDICNNKIQRLPVDAVEKICDALDLEPGDFIKRIKAENE